MSEYRETMSAPVGDLREIREKFWMALEDQPTVMLARLNSGDHAVPMRAQLDRHAHGKFWFFTKRENRCAAGGPAMAQFVGKGQNMFACIAGLLVESCRGLVSRWPARPQPPRAALRAGYRRNMGARSRYFRSLQIAHRRNHPARRRRPARRDLAQLTYGKAVSPA